MYKVLWRFKMAKIYNFDEEMKQEIERIGVKEEILGKTLMQPFVANNSGSRKILFSIQLEHSLPLLAPEVPYIQTGYENSFGDYSSSIIEAKEDFEVVDKIIKFHYVFQFPVLGKTCYFHF